MTGVSLQRCAEQETRNDPVHKQIVVITGGTSGIGLAAARQFIKEEAFLASDHAS